MTDSTTTTIETLTAEVQTLMVGSRQVTLSVYGQLEKVPSALITPMGRVAPKDSEWGYVYVVGKNISTGELCRARTPCVKETITQAVRSAINIAEVARDLKSAEEEAAKLEGEAQEAEEEAAAKLNGTKYGSRSYSASGQDEELAKAEACLSEAATELERLKALAEAAQARYKAAGFRAGASALYQRAGELRKDAKESSAAAARLRVDLATAEAAWNQRYAALTELATEWWALPLIVLAGLR